MRTPKSNKHVRVGLSRRTAARRMSMNPAIRLLAVSTWILLVALGCGAPTSPEPPPATPAMASQDVTPQPPESKETTTPPKQTSATDASGASVTPLMSPGTTGDVPEIVARVGDEVVTGKEFGRHLSFRMQDMRAHGMPVQMNDEARAAALQEIVDDKVLGILARQAGTEPSEEELKAEFNARKAKLRSEEEYQRYLQQMDLTEQDMIELVRGAITKEKYIDEKCKDVTVTEEKITSEYSRLKEQGKLERPSQTYDVSHILIEVKGADEAAWADAKQRIDAARARIVAGEKFADVAREVSEDPVSKDEGGAYPEVPRGKMTPEFDKMMAQSPVGEISEPFRSEYGWHILTVTAKNEPGTMTLEQVRKPLTRFVQNTEKQKILKQLVDEAKNNIKVEILYPSPRPTTTPVLPPESEPAAQPQPSPEQKPQGE